MSGTSTPSRSSFSRMTGTARAASSLLTVMRTSSEPACASWATWMAVPSGSAVSVFVIDWTTIGWLDPTGTPPTRTVAEGRRSGEDIELMVERATAIGTQGARTTPPATEAAPEG
jgi:hypothetical protein